MNTARKLPPFQGIGTALITPFCDGRPDLSCFRALIRRQIDAGIAALIVSGTTGEAATLHESERAALLSAACEEAAGRVPIIAGAGAADTRQAVALARYAATHGADALLVVTPYYNKGTREGIVRHYLSIAEAVDTPIILYNVPSRTGVSLPIDSLRRLAEHENIVAIKEASGDIDRVADILSALGDALPVYSGNDSQTLPILSLGGIGAISVIANLLPEETVSLYQSYCAGRVQEAAKTASASLPFTRLLFADTNPAPIKYAMACRGLCREEVRLPLTPPGAPLAEHLARSVAAL